MNYVKSNLLLNEQIIAFAKVHWSVFIRGLIFLCFGLMIGIADKRLGGFFILVGISLLIYSWLYSISTELAVTNKRIIAKQGLIRQTSLDLLHSNIEGFHVEQGIMGQLLSFGTIIINGTGAGRAPLQRIAAPLEFRKRVLIAIDQRSSV